MANFDNIIQEINTNLPDNNTQAITAAKLRTTLIDLTNQIDTVQDDFETEINTTIASNIVDNLNSTATDKSLSANQGNILGSIVGTVVSEGNGNTLVNRRVSNIIPNHTYRVFVQNPSINRSEVPSTSSTNILFTIAYYDSNNTAVYIVLVPATFTSALQDYYDFTAPSDCTYVNMSMKANVGEKQTLVISDITNEVKKYGNKTENVRIYNNARIASYNSTSVTTDENCMIVSVPVNANDIIEYWSGRTANSASEVGSWQFWSNTTRLIGATISTNGSAQEFTAPSESKMFFATFRKNCGAGYIKVNGNIVYHNTQIIFPEENTLTSQPINEISNFTVGGIKWNFLNSDNHYAYSIARLPNFVNSIRYNIVSPPGFTVHTNTVCKNIIFTPSSITANIAGNERRIIGNNGYTFNDITLVIRKSDNSEITQDELKDCYVKLYDNSFNSESVYFDAIKEDGVVEASGVYGAYLVKTTSELTKWGDMVSDYYPSYPTLNTIRARINPLYFERKDEQKAFFIQKPSTLSLVSVYLADDDKPVMSNGLSSIPSQFNYTYNEDIGVVSIRTFNANCIGFTFSKGGEEITQAEVDAIKVWHYVGTREMAERLQNRANPWFGKTYAAIGDSITYGFIPRNSPGGDGTGRLRSYARIAAGNLGMNFFNYGISGNYLSHTSSNNGMCERYVNMVDTADLITFMGGTNDFRYNVPLGTFSDRINTTYYGALHILMQGLYTKYIGGVSPEIGCKKQIVAITPIKMLDKSKSSLANTIENNANILYQWDGWIDAVKEVAAFYSIPVFDAYNLSGINPHLDRTLHGFYGDYTGYYNPYITDGTHPTVEGQQIFGDNFTGFLKSLK